MAAMAGTLTTRAAVRVAALDDLIARCELAAVAIEGGALDGVQVVSMGTLRDQVTAALLVDLPDVPDKYAEVSTPASVQVDAICPECGESVDVGVKMIARLVVQDGITEIAVKAKSKAVMHLHGQQRLPGVPGQVAAFDDVITEQLEGLADNVAQVADAAVEAARSEAADTEPQICVGSNHFPGCPHFPQIPKRTVGDA